MGYFYGDISELYNASVASRKSFLFFLTAKEGPYPCGARRFYLRESQMLRSACPRAAGLSALFPFEDREINLFGEALSESCKRGFFCASANRPDRKSVV